MKKIKELLIKYKEVIVYVIFGVLTTLVNFATFWICQKVIGDEGYRYLLNNAIAWVVGVSFAFITNKIFVFESKSFKPKVFFKELSEFVAARLLSFGVEEFGMFLFVDLLHFERFSLDIMSFTIDGKMIAKAFLAVIVIIMNYFFSKFVIFKKKKNNKNAKSIKE